MLPAYLLSEELQAEWLDLESAVEIAASRLVTATGNFSIEKKYYISSLKASSDEFNQVVRSHWVIENNLHLSLDVQFKEDQSRKRANLAAANFGVILRFALSMLKNYPERISVKRKRNKNVMSDQYREDVMGI